MKCDDPDRTGFNDTLSDVADILMSFRSDDLQGLPMRTQGDFCTGGTLGEVGITQRGQYQKDIFGSCRIGRMGEESAASAPADDDMFGFKLIQNDLGDFRADIQGTGDLPLGRQFISRLQAVFPDKFQDIFPGLFRQCLFCDHINPVNSL